MFGNKVLVLSVCALALGLSSPASAGDHGKGRGNGNGGGKERAESYERHEGHHYDEHHEGRDDDKITIRLGDDDRLVIREYIREGYHRNCPPGLAKKNNGCLPPGQAKKYAVGDILGPDVAWIPLPDDLLRRLHPAPAGHQYIQVDKDIYLIGEASKKIIDAVTLLSALE